jgi:hypothetical protein
VYRPREEDWHTLCPVGKGTQANLEENDPLCQVPGAGDKRGVLWVHLGGASTQTWEGDNVCLRTDG